MSNEKPFHRNYRPMKPGENSGSNNWAYIRDEKYAQNAEHYIRAFLIIQADLIKLFEFIEPSDVNLKTYSFRIHELLMRTCIEIEANFKAIFKENIYSPTNSEGKNRTEKDWNINDYKKINVTHRLSDYTAELPIWKGEKKRWQPFDEWIKGKSLIWYQAYNKSKHDRLHSFEEANLENLLSAFSGLFILLSSQFRTENFSPGPKALGGYLGDSGSKPTVGIGGYLVVEFPKNWDENEMYDFDWADLHGKIERFAKIDYNNIT